ncbi:MFS transporter [Asanoa ishikariensis]|uniref:Predicted arabinose efflux permease, MFS family n=1 Tax=Asanoa ishikariensis TaxID=137265 RepID=A0A1H3LIG6_9ACTN|nr:MFS transporter [Asanoa ishikariensis]GIF65506.1 MFS transporter [Asanoa ishikariensis]SDY64191.1 Predicted arabinose efflux permease, MFS family [Asanoa ishikariensis]
MSGTRRRWAIDLRPLATPSYRRMWIGTAFSNYGYQFTAVAVPVEMFALTGKSLWVGLLGIAALVPLLVFGLWGGALADAMDRRRLLVIGSVVMWLGTLGFFVQSLAGWASPWLLLVFTAVQSCAFAVTNPTRSAIIPRLVPANLVPAANTLSFTTGEAAVVLGPLTVGVILATFNQSIALPIAYGADALLFTVGLWSTLRLPPIPPAAQAARAGLRSVVEGFRYLAGAPVLLLSFAIDIIAMTIAMPRALFPEMADERFGGGAAVGFLFSAIAIGSVLGGLTSGWIGRVRRQGLALVGAVVAWGVLVGLAGFAHSLWLMVVVLALAGAADLVSAVFRHSILLVYAPDQMRGRLQGVMTVVVAGGPRLGDLRAGGTAALWGAGAAFSVGGFAAAGLAIALALVFPALTRYRSADPQVEPDPRPAAAPEPISSGP